MPNRPKSWSALYHAALLLLAIGGGCSSNPPAPRDAATKEAAVVVDTPPPDVAPPRCTSSASCAGSPGRPICDMTSGQCVSCMMMASACGAGTYCNSASGSCDVGCASDMGCTSSNDAGVTLNRCDPATRTCVACVTNDHCPPGNLCRGSVCAPGCSATSACPMGSSCCDGSCVNTQANIASCGTCGNTCRVANGTAVCTAGACAVGMCATGYADCDMNAANGCEVNLQNDPTQCGMCGTRCPVGAGSVGTCAMGRCGLACGEGLGDCDVDPSNGCEVDTRTTLTHCGACGRGCSPRNATGACRAGVCAIAACSAGSGDCDMDSGNGCETDLNANVFSCGACGTTCTLANAQPACTAGRCAIARCEPGFADCDMNPMNGCEVNTDTSNGNCGMCARSCGMGSCTRGVCTSMCAGALGDCDGNATNGCEAMLNTDVSNCGACRNACVAGPESRAACAAGACSLTCSTGFANCNRNPADGCEVDTRVSPTNCGGCGTTCASGQVCNDSRCVAPCPGVQTRCGAVCVALLSDNSNCGACGRACASGSTCTDGVCRCAIGAAPTAGVRCGAACVDVLTDSANCGTCGTACPSGSTCNRGVCRCAISGVPIGLLCGTACVDPLADRNNCGRCGNACPTGNTCTSGVCRCPTGGVTCAGVCTDTTLDRANCGACGTVCAAAQTCQSSVCRACAGGTTFCADTCADTQNDPANCGGCGTRCATGQVCLAARCTSAPPTRYSVTERPSGLAFIDACTTPGHAEYLAGADDSNVLVTLPFAFRYWAVNLPAGANINITSNGWIGMDGVSSATYNFPIPLTTAPNALIAGYEGDDQNRGPQCVATVGVAPTRTWVHGWNDAHHCCGEMDVHTTYAIMLREGSNIIEIVYPRMTGTRAQYLGMENQTGSVGIGGCPGGTFNCVPTSGYAVRFNPIP